MTHPLTHILAQYDLHRKEDMPEKKKMPDDLMHAIASLLLSLGWCTQKLGQLDYSVC